MVFLSGYMVRVSPRGQLRSYHFYFHDRKLKAVCIPWQLIACNTGSFSFLLMDKLFSSSLSLVDQKGKNVPSEALKNKSSFSKRCKTACVFTHSVLLFMFVCAFLLKNHLGVISESQVYYPSIHSKWMRSHGPSALSPAR